ncbi:MAG: GNAT family N-acetyltransferase [Anaerolineae bacterium]|nr:GNAT family N-acetyltransferase [Anaerolineae bacterium]
MSAAIAIQRIRFWDIPAITRLVFANMVGVDVDFTELTGTPFRRALSYLFVPVYLLTAGRGYKARHEGEIAGCAYYHLRQRSGFVFNVSVAERHRRQGIATQLMQHLEHEIEQARRFYVGLHVDRDNLPAQRLYQGLGYRPYHPYFLRQPEAVPAAHRGGSLALEELPRRTGSQRFRAFQRREREAGDPWAAAVVAADYGNNIPSGGRFWRIEESGSEIGALWLGDATGTRQAMLALDPTCWDRRDLRESIYEGIVAAGGPWHGALEIYLGSSAHHEAALAHWTEMGFVPRRRARILMLKRLQGG